MKVLILCLLLVSFVYPQDMDVISIRPLNCYGVDITTGSTTFEFDRASHYLGLKPFFSYGGFNFSMNVLYCFGTNYRLSLTRKKYYFMTNIILSYNLFTIRRN